MLLFNSKKTAYKYPFGALATDTELHITFPVSDDLKIDRAFIVVRLDREVSRIQMEFTRKENGFNFFECRFSLMKVGIYYYRFELEIYGAKHNIGRAQNGDAVMGEWLPEWQLTVYDKSFNTPDKYKGGLIYQIFPDRFCRSGTIPLQHIGIMRPDWGGKPGTKDFDGIYRASDFFGGDLKGIVQKLPYLKELGVTLIYLNPIFESVSNHRYDTGNYLKIDSLLGDEEDLTNLCFEAKQLGIGVVLDGVFNHTGSESVYFNKSRLYDSVGAYNDYNSRFHDWYYFVSFPNEYRSWWGIGNVPTVNKENLEYQNLIMGKDGVLEKWQGCGISGWRLDVVDELPIDFTTALCKKIKRLNKDALIIGEVWEDASTKVSYGEWRPYFMGNQLDGVMNYPFMHAIADYVKGGKAEKLRNCVDTILENYPRCVIECLMNIIDTHDTERAINRYSNATKPTGSEESRAGDLSAEQYALGKARLMLASTIQYTLPGMPSLYYGDEVGMTGWTDPYSRGCYPWGNEDESLLKHYKRLGALRKDYRKYFTEAFEFIDANDLLCYTCGDNGELTVVVNNTDAFHYAELDGTEYFCGDTVKGRTEIAPHSFMVVISKDAKRTS